MHLCKQGNTHLRSRDYSPLSEEEEGFNHTRFMKKSAPADVARIPTIKFAQGGRLSMLVLEHLGRTRTSLNSLLFDSHMSF